MNFQARYNFKDLGCYAIHCGQRECHRRTQEHIKCKFVILAKCFLDQRKRSHEVTVIWNAILVLVLLTLFQSRHAIVVVVEVQEIRSAIQVGIIIGEIAIAIHIFHWARDAIAVWIIWWSWLAVEIDVDKGTSHMLIWVQINGHAMGHGRKGAIIAIGHDHAVDFACAEDIIQSPARLFQLFDGMWPWL